MGSLPEFLALVSGMRVRSADLFVVCLDDGENGIRRVRLTESQLQGLQRGEAPKRAKYGNDRQWIVDRIRFDSKLEAGLYEKLKLRRAAGHLRAPYFLCQTRFDLPGGVKYRLDFMAFPVGEAIEYFDCKGYDTALSKLKRKQVEALYDITIQLWRGR